MIPTDTSALRPAPLMTIFSIPDDRLRNWLGVEPENVLFDDFGG